MFCFCNFVKLPSQHFNKDIQGRHGGAEKFFCLVIYNLYVQAYKIIYNLYTICIQSYTIWWRGGYTIWESYLAIPN